MWIMLKYINVVLISTPGFLQRKPRNSWHLTILPGDQAFPFPGIVLDKTIEATVCILTPSSQDSASFTNEEHSDFAPIKFIASIQNSSLFSRKSFSPQIRSSVSFFAGTARSRCLAQFFDTYRRVGENVLSMEESSPCTSESKTYDERRLHMLKCRDACITEKHRLARNPW